MTRMISTRSPSFITFARKLTLHPRVVTSQDREVLRRDAGLEDVEMLDLVQIVGYFNYANRLIAGLDIKLETEEEEDGRSL